MLQRDTFFGRRNEKNAEHPQRSPSLTGFGAPAAQLHSTLPGTAAPAGDALKAAKKRRPPLRPRATINKAAASSSARISS